MERAYLADDIPSIREEPVFHFSRERVPYDSQLLPEAEVAPCKPVRIDHRIPDRPGIIVALFLRTKQFTPESVLEVANCLAVYRKEMNGHNERPDDFEG